MGQEKILAGDIKDNGLTIVLPVYNEKDVIERIILDVHAYTARLVSDLEIIAVNDGSTDGTREILDRVSRSLPNLKVISHGRNIGYGGALVSGIKAAEKPWILLMDSDGQMQIGSLQAAWPYRHEYDLLLGYRKKRADGFYRRMLGKLGNLSTNISLGLHLVDINCGFKLFKTDIVQPLSLSSTGGLINWEILRLIFKADPLFQLLLLPVAHYPRMAGRPTGGNLRTVYRIIVEGVNLISR